MRYTALRISDVATLRKDRVGRDGTIRLRTLKTGGHVFLPLPRVVLDALAVLPEPRGAPAQCPYFFWNGVASQRAVVGISERTMAAVFAEAGVTAARSHRFRHTLATEILTKGGTEQDVADILGISPAIVRKHYAKWTQDRQERVSRLLKLVHADAFSGDEGYVTGTRTN